MVQEDLGWTTGCERRCPLSNWFTILEMGSYRLFFGIMHRTKISSGQF